MKDLNSYSFCSYCHYTYNEQDIIKLYENNFYHEHCLTRHKRELNGFIHQCPKCVTSGNIFVDGLVDCSYEEARDRALYSGSTYDVENKIEYYKVKGKIKTTCDLCDGIGYLKNEPKKIIKVEYKKSE